MNNDIHIELKEKMEKYVSGGLTNEEVQDLWVELVQNESYLDYLKNIANLQKAMTDVFQKQPSA